MVGCVVFLSAIVAGLIQAVTGFGSGIFMMMFFPAFFPLLSASALSSSIGLMITGGIAWRYRKYCRLKLTLFPAVFYILSSSAAMSLAPYMPTDLLRKIFGFFLVVLSIYFILSVNALKVKASLPMAVFCSSLSGIVGGLFGISGPPMVIYFLAVLPEKKSYLGTIELFFFFTGIYNLVFRIFAGIYGVNLVVYTLLGMAAVWIGMFVGDKIVNRMDVAIMKKVTYVFLGLSGLLNIFK